MQSTEIPLFMAGQYAIGSDIDPAAMLQDLLSAGKLPAPESIPPGEWVHDESGYCPVTFHEEFFPEGFPLATWGSTAVLTPGGWQMSPSDQCLVYGDTLFVFSPDQEMSWHSRFVRVSA